MWKYDFHLHWNTSRVCQWREILKGFVKNLASSCGQGNGNRTGWYHRDEDSPLGTWILSSPSKLRRTHLISLLCSASPLCPLYSRTTQSNIMVVHMASLLLGWKAVQEEIGHVLHSSATGKLFQYRNRAFLPDRLGRVVVVPQETGCSVRFLAACPCHVMFGHMFVIMAMSVTKSFHNLNSGCCHLFVMFWYRWLVSKNCHYLQRDTLED